MSSPRHVARCAYKVHQSMLAMAGDGAALEDTKNESRLSADRQTLRDSKFAGQTCCAFCKRLCPARQMLKECLCLLHRVEHYYYSSSVPRHALPACQLAVCSSAGTSQDRLHLSVRDLPGCLENEVLSNDPVFMYPGTVVIAKTYLKTEQQQATHSASLSSLQP